MLKRKPKEKKTIDSFVEMVPAKAEIPDLCACGKPSHPEHAPQCWDCSHRK